jgi:hypothetical protein
MHGRLVWGQQTLSRVCDESWPDRRIARRDAEHAELRRTQQFRFRSGRCVLRVSARSFLTACFASSQEYSALPFAP